MARPCYEYEGIFLGGLECLYLEYLALVKPVKLTAPSNLDSEAWAVPIQQENADVVLDSRAKPTQEMD